ncbi:MAG: hypothetical protein EOP51_01080 [Sphingobacteriales bacterium]|nr:MAG: hypothetical protein EOP51_01080 [Sphingobacteriales bacterium]
MSRIYVFIACLCFAAFAACNKSNNIISTNNVNNVNNVQNASISYRGIAISKQYLSFNTNADTSHGVVWDFGDGSTAQAVNPLHAYGAAGNYTVTVSDNTGIKLASKDIAIEKTTHVYGLEGITRKWKVINSSVTYANGKNDTSYVGETSFEVLGINDTLVMPNFGSKLYPTQGSVNNADSLRLFVGFQIHGFAEIYYNKRSRRIVAYSSYSGAGGSSTTTYETID